MSVISGLDLIGSNINKINDILEHGILSTKELKGKKIKVITSYDQKDNDKVSYNLIRTLEGIGHSLYHKARGVFTVVMERKDDLFWSNFVKSNEQQINELFNEISHKFSDLGQEMCQKVANQKVLNQNESSLAILKERVTRCALIVFSTNDPQIGKNLVSSREYRAKSIPVEKITHVILDKETFEGMKDRIKLGQCELIFVDKIKKQNALNYVPFSPHDIKLDNMIVPDFESALKKIFSQRSFQGPIGVHGVRLDVNEDIETVLESSNVN